MFMQKYFNTYRKVVVLLLTLLSLMGGVQSIGYSSLEIESGDFTQDNALASQRNGSRDCRNRPEVYGVD